MASLYDTLAKKFPGLGGEELDRKIFHQPDFQTKMRTSEDMFKSVIKFLKFKKFGVEMSSRMITSILPIIKELMEFEKSKFKETGAKPASSKPKKGGGGKKGAKGAAKGVGNPIESKILIDTCQELLNVLEAFNTEERLGEPLCQVRIREKMVTIIRARLIGFGANIFDIAAYPAGHKVSPNIFESRMKQVWPHTSFIFFPFYRFKFIPSLKDTALVSSNPSKDSSQTTSQNIEGNSYLHGCQLCFKPK